MSLPFRRRWLWWICPAALIILVVAVSVGWILLASLGGEPDYRARAGKLVSCVEDSIPLPGPGRAWEVSLRGERLSLRGRVRAPDDVDRRWPALVILGGLQTGRRTVDYINAFQEDAGSVLLALDYPYEGPKRDLSWLQILRLIPRIRTPCFDTPAALLLAVDYLSQRPDVDPRRIVLVGGSLGCFFVPAAAAQDARPAAVVLVYGLADIRSFLEKMLEPWPFLSPILSRVGRRLLDPLDPVHTVPRIAPRPLLVVNASGDERFPEACVEALHRVAQQPCTKIWLPISHASPRETEEAKKVYAVVEEWLKRQEIL